MVVDDCLVSQQNYTIWILKGDVMNKAFDYLEQEYGNLYRTIRREDAIHYILTNHKDKDGLTFDVYDYSDELLAACLPPQAARKIMQKHPGTFTVHQDASDGMVLLFDESLLHELADSLRIRRKRRISEEERKRLARVGFKSARHTTMRRSKQAEFGRSFKIQDLS